MLDLSAVSAPGRNFLLDLAIFDGSVSYELTPAPQIGDIPSFWTKTTLVLKEDRVRERIEQFNELWDLTSPVQS
ncbi:hypothetical protein GCM10027290_59780 [Micromonospora sonneratiae]|uniref:Uncharacterized protein n=1 Tax=Micromonospora sonneratiae TaxID=1184706 RepID=A0ABW3YA11_9ACTN